MHRIAQTFNRKSEQRDAAPSKSKEKHRPDSERDRSRSERSGDASKRQHTADSAASKSDEPREEKSAKVEKSRDDDRTKANERDVDGQQSGDGTPGSHHSGDSGQHRRANDSAKQAEERGIYL